jgi:hypothetical protein
MMMVMIMMMMMTMMLMMLMMVMMVSMMLFTQIDWVFPCYLGDDTVRWAFGHKHNITCHIIS